MRYEKCFRRSRRASPVRGLASNGPALAYWQLVAAVEAANSLLHFQLRAPLGSPNFVPLAAQHRELTVRVADTGSRSATEMRGRPALPVRLFDDGLGAAYGQRKGTPPGTKRGFFLVIAVAVIVGSELQSVGRAWLGYNVSTRVHDWARLVGCAWSPV
jgi:hypothetical protein